jgi:hypothetical protein
LYCYATPYFYDQNLKSKLENFGHKKNLLISQEVLLVAGTGLHTNIYFLTILLESVIHTEHL